MAYCNITEVPGNIGIPFDGGQWTGRTLLALRELWELGYSTKAIANYLRFSKNAVVGQAHRLHLPSRPSPILRDMNIEAVRPRISGPTLPPLASDIGLEGDAVLLGPPPQLNVWITPDRKAVLVKHWEGYTQRKLIIEVIAALPGGPVTSADAVGMYASKTLGIKRPVDVRHNIPAINEASRRFCLEYGLSFVPLREAATKVREPRERKRENVRPSATEVVRAVPVAPPKPYGRVVTCCWPTNDGPQWTFCDEPSEPGRPYCRDHVTRAYIRVRDRREDRDLAAMFAAGSSLLFGKHG